jgi:hypothetical protein
MTGSSAFFIRPLSAQSFQRAGWLAAAAGFGTVHQDGGAALLQA